MFIRREIFRVFFGIMVRELQAVVFFFLGPPVPLSTNLHYGERYGVQQGLFETSEFYLSPLKHRSNNISYVPGRLYTQMFAHKLHLIVCVILSINGHGFTQYIFSILVLSLEK